MLKRTMKFAFQKLGLLYPDLEAARLELQQQHHKTQLSISKLDKAVDEINPMTDMSMFLRG